MAQLLTGVKPVSSAPQHPSGPESGTSVLPVSAPPPQSSTTPSTSGRPMVYMTATSNNGAMAVQGPDPATNGQQVLMGSIAHGGVLPEPAASVVASPDVTMRTESGQKISISFNISF